MNNKRQLTTRSRLCYSPRRKLIVEDKQPVVSCQEIWPESSFGYHLFLCLMDPFLFIEIFSWSIAIYLDPVMDPFIIYYDLLFLSTRFVLDGLYIRFRLVLDYPQTPPDRLSTGFPWYFFCPGTFWLAWAASEGRPRRPFSWRLLIGRAFFGLSSHW